MRFFAPILSVLAAVAVAQSSDCTANCINVPVGGLVVTAGQPITLTWSNPTNSKITIKLQTSENITPTSGTTLITGVDASTGTYTVTVPTDVASGVQYVFETIDEDNTSIYNFSPPFAINGATGTASTGSATATGSTASTASTGTASTGSSSMTSTASSASSTNSSASTASKTSSQSASNTSSSAMTSATTSVPNGNGATSMKVEAGAMLALVAGVAALL